MVKIREISEQDRPRERLARLGAKALSTQELLAILIRTGTKGKSAIEIASEMMSTFGSLKRLFQASHVELSKIKGLSTAKIATLLASYELSKRYASEFEGKKLVIKKPQDVYEHYKAHLIGLTKEIFIAIYLNSRNEVLFDEERGTSTGNSCQCHPQEFIRGLLSKGGTRLILIHNHPSGDKTPSQNDITFTTELSSHLAYFGFELLDHIIISDNGFVSLKEEGFIR